MDRITSALQNHDISRLKAECKRIRCYIRTCFIDDSDNTKRNTFLPDQKTVRPFFHTENFPDRIVQLGYLTETFRHRLDATLIQKQPVQKTFGHSFFSSMLHIQRICRDNRIGIRHKIFRCFFQHTVFRLCPHDAKHRFRPTGSRSDFFQLHHTRLLLVLSYRNWLNGKSSALSPASAAECPSPRTAPHQTAETQTPLQPL